MGRRLAGAKTWLCSEMSTSVIHDASGHRMPVTRQSVRQMFTAALYLGEWHRQVDQYYHIEYHTESVTEITDVTTTYYQSPRRLTLMARLHCYDIRAFFSELLLS